MLLSEGHAIAGSYLSGGPMLPTVAMVSSALFVAEGHFWVPGHAVDLVCVDFNRVFYYGGWERAQESWS